MGDAARPEHLFPDGLLATPYRPNHLFKPAGHDLRERRIVAMSELSLSSIIEAISGFTSTDRRSPSRPDRAPE